MGSAAKTKGTNAKSSKARGNSTSHNVEVSKRLQVLWGSQQHGQGMSIKLPLIMPTGDDAECQNVLGQPFSWTATVNAVSELG